MPDLETFHIKRSKVQNVHYVHILHSLNSVHVALRKNALDNFDAIFCASKYHIDEIRGAERSYNLPKKILVEQGYCRLENLLEDVKNNRFEEFTESASSSKKSNSSSSNIESSSTYISSLSSSSKSTVMSKRVVPPNF